jgi:hypothetical protein
MSGSVLVRNSGDFDWMGCGPSWRCFYMPVGSSAIRRCLSLEVNMLMQQQQQRHRQSECTSWRSHVRRCGQKARLRT